MPIDILWTINIQGFLLKKPPLVFGKAALGAASATSGIAVGNAEPLMAILATAAMLSPSQVAGSESSVV